MKKILIFVFLILLLGNSFAQEFYPTTIGELNAVATLKGKGTIKGLEEGQEVNFQTLTFQESEFQKVKLIHEELYINGKTFYPEYVVDEYGNKYVNFKITENGDFYYELKAEIENTAIVHDLIDYNLPKSYSEEISQYLERSENVESDSKEILTVASNKLYTNNFIDTLNKTIYWVNDYVEYATGNDFQRYYLLQESAINTLLNKKGVCDEFANLAAGLLRAKNIPTKLAIGITFDGKEWGNHAWLEVYHNEFGWIPSDPTFRETGFVDATHIKLGSFIDVSKSLSKATFPSNTSVVFQTQTIETLPEVEILSKEYFSHARLNTTTTNFQTNKWNELKIEVKNNTSGLLTIPVKIIDNYNDLLFDEKTKSIELGAGEKGIITFRIYPLIELNNNQIAKGTFNIYSLSEPYQANFEITKGSSENNGFVKVKDVVPIMLDDKIRFDIKLLNTFSTEEEVTITINKNDYSWSEQIIAFASKEIQKEITFDKNYYELVIITPTEEYSQKIYPAIVETIVTEEPKETIITQEIKTDNNQNIQETLSQSPELIVFALLPIIAFIILVFFSMKKQYI